MPQPDADGFIRIEQDAWRETMDQLNQLVRERNKARRELSAARRVGRIACTAVIDLADWIEEHDVRHDKAELQGFRDDVDEIREALTPKRRRR